MQAVFISALTAAVVTLLIEYAAKPHLEVRKDRILDSHRARRDLISKINFASRHGRPISGITDAPPGFGKPGVEAMEDFLTMAHGIEIDFTQISLSLGTFQRNTAERFVNHLAAERATAGLFLHMHKEKGVDDPTAAQVLNESLTKSVKEITFSMAALLRVLSVRPGKPWSYYKTLRRLPQSPKYSLAGGGESHAQAESEISPTEN